MLNATGSMVKYVRFHLKDLPQTEFGVLLDKNLQKRLIERAVENLYRQTGIRWGKYKELARYLKAKCKSLEQVKVNSIWDTYLPNWKLNGKFISIDCLLELCKLAKANLESIEKQGVKVKYKISPNRTAINFPFVYNEDFAFFSEAIQTDGHLSKNFNRIDIASRSLDFMEKVKNSAKSIGIPDNCLYYLYKFEVDVPEDKILSVRDTEGKSIKFNIYYKKISKKFKLILHQQVADFEKEIIINTESRIIHIKPKVTNSQLEIETDYGYAGATLSLNISNTTFVRILNLFLKIPVGRKCDTVRLPEQLKVSPQSVKIAAINAVLAAESTVEVKGKKIAIGMNSRSYLEDIKEILKEFRIRTSIFSNTLLISGYNNIFKFSRDFNPIIMYKRNNIKRILNSYSHIRYEKKEGLFRTLLHLKEKDLNAYQVAELLKRHKDTAFTHLNQGIKLGNIKRNSDVVPYMYSITPDGEKYLEETECYV